MERVVHCSIDAEQIECNRMRAHTKEGNSMKQEVCET